jgi:tRNA pseudouridine55 synthase
MNGILNIDKPAGMTSHDVVARVRRLTRVKRVGHAGTLDPDATGVLVVCIGQATRLADLLAEQGKSYLAKLRLGVATSTEDASGEVLEQCDAAHITREDLAALLPRFTGDIMQTPPMVSAVHHEGKRLYELARAGVTVERAARPVRIDSLTLLDFIPGEHPSADLLIDCGKGTYIRTLCADIGATLGVGGHMETLRRTRVGTFRVDAAALLAELTPEDIASRIVPAADAVGFLPAHGLDSPERVVDIRHGKAVPTALPDTALVRVLDTAGCLIALGRAEQGTLYPEKVFAGEIV